MVAVPSKYSSREIAFAKELSKYQDQWVAIISDGKVEKIVASGERIADAKFAAEKAGVKDPTFRKIPAKGKILIA